MSHPSQQHPHPDMAPQQWDNGSVNNYGGGQDNYYNGGTDYANNSGSSTYDPYSNTYGQTPPSTDTPSQCGGDTMCCVAACFMPSIAYGLNYSLARQQPIGACCCPCMINTVLDCLPYAVLSIALSALHMTPYFATFPLGCVCRAQQRYAVFGHPEQHHGLVQMSEKEHCLESIALETLCWGCSLAQMHTRLNHRKQQRAGPPLAGNDLLGTLHVQPQPANTMYAPQQY